LDEALSLRPSLNKAIAILPKLNWSVGIYTDFFKL